MGGDLNDLYQELILDHQKNPRNFGGLPGANRHAEGYNPLCGDRISLDLALDTRGVVTGVGFKGSGCAISRASASLMTVALKGKTREEAWELFELFHSLVTGAKTPGVGVDKLGKLRVFSGVKDFPARVKCATLAWHTMKAALSGNEPPGGASPAVTTEEGG